MHASRLGSPEIFRIGLVLCLSAASTAHGSSPASATRPDCLRYFGERWPGSLDVDLACDFSRSLEASSETPLQGRGPEVEAYRLTVLSIDGPAVIRIERRAGVATLYLTVLSHDWDPKVIQRREKRLTTTEWNSLVEGIGRTSLWSTKATPSQSGGNGSDWLLEGMRDGEYGLLEAWSPPEGALREIGHRLRFFTGS